MRFMMRIFISVFICVALIGLIRISESRKDDFSTKEDTNGSVIVSVASLHQPPQNGDTIRCEDGSCYTITDVSQYQQTPADPALETIFIDAFSDLAPKADAIHFTDIFGDYLFVKNRYEIYRMLFVLNQSLDPVAVNVQFSIPEDAIPEILDSWDPDWISEFQHSHLNKSCCLEAWDIYKNGSFQKTVYLAAAI